MIPEKLKTQKNRAHRTVKSTAHLEKPTTLTKGILCNICQSFQGNVSWNNEYSCAMVMKAIWRWNTHWRDMFWCIIRKWQKLMDCCLIFFLCRVLFIFRVMSYDIWMVLIQFKLPDWTYHIILSQSSVFPMVFQIKSFSYHLSHVNGSLVQS